MSRGRDRRRLLGALPAAVALAATLGCSEFDRLADYAFPPTVPGLPRNASWVSLPIGGWVTEGGVEARAIAACFSPTCPARVGVGLFRAEGRDAALLSAIVGDPERLKRGLEAKDRDDPAPRPRPLRTEITVAPLREGTLPGFALRLARPDGSRAAHAIVLATAGSGPVSVLIVIGESAEAVRRVAHAVADRLS
jgi:hypothetical protein